MTEERLLLAADVGATKCWLALLSGNDAAPDLRLALRYDDRAFGSFDEVLEAFLGEARARFGALAFAGACFAVAAPVSGACVRLTNRSWRLDPQALAQRLGVAAVALVNDFAAAARGIDRLAPGDCVALQTGEPLAHAPGVVLGAGTGLGVAYRVWTGNGYQGLAGEAGHMGFAPCTAEQVELWRFLHRRRGRVSAEDVLSGRGLAAIYRFLAGVDAAGSADAEPAAAVQRAAETGDPVASHALELFAEIYGSVAGDHALAVLARGGVYLAGGIVPRILERLRSGGFIQAFNDKREHEALLRRMPVYAVMEERLALFGAAALALDLYQQRPAGRD
jgi:glucokinase